MQLISPRTLCALTDECFVMAGSLLGARGTQATGGLPARLCDCRVRPCSKDQQFPPLAFLSASHRPLPGARRLLELVWVEVRGGRLAAHLRDPGADPQPCAPRPSGLRCVHRWALRVGGGAWAVTPSSLVVSLGFLLWNGLPRWCSW